MTASYQVVITNPLGGLAEIISSFASLTMARAFNEVGSLTLVLPNILTPTQVTADYRVYVYRTVDGGEMYLEGDTFYFVNKVQYNVDDDTWTLHGEDALCILKRRLVGYTSETAYADKTGKEFDKEDPPRDLLKADDMIKEYVSENLGPEAIDTTRDMSAYIRIEPDYALCPEVEKQAGWAELLSTCQDIAKMSEELGTKLYFDFVNVSGDKMLFKTFAQSRGVFRGEGSSSPTIFTPTVNMLDTSIIWDYSKEVTYVYAGGIGSGDGRFIVEKALPGLRSSPFRRIETFVDARDAEIDETDVINDKIDGVLRGARPKLLVEGTAIDGPGTVYGKDYFYGDVVAVIVLGYNVPCAVDAFNLTVDGNGESLDVRLRGERDI